MIDPKIVDDRVHLSPTLGWDKGSTLGGGAPKRSALGGGLRGQERVEKKSDPFSKIHKSLFYYSIHLFMLSLPQKEKNKIKDDKSSMLTKQDDISLVWLHNKIAQYSDYFM